MLHILPFSWLFLILVQNLLINGFAEKFIQMFESGWLSASLRIESIQVSWTLERDFGFFVFISKPKAISLNFNLLPHWLNMNIHDKLSETNEKHKFHDEQFINLDFCWPHSLVKNYKSYSSVKLSIRDEYGSIWMKRFQ